MHIFICTIWDGSWIVRAISLPIEFVSSIRVELLRKFCNVTLQRLWDLYVVQACKNCYRRNWNSLEWLCRTFVGLKSEQSEFNGQSNNPFKIMSLHGNHSTKKMSIKSVNLFMRTVVKQSNNFLNFLTWLKSFYGVYQKIQKFWDTILYIGRTLAKITDSHTYTQ